MKRFNLWLAAALVVAPIALAGCTQAESAAARVREEPAQLVPIPGSELNKVVLTAGAAERIGIKTELGREVSTTVPGQGEGKHTVIPVGAVIFDRQATTWVYTTSEPLNYIRQPVIVARSDGDIAVLQSGPGAGTAVVSVGAAELLGIEYGVEGE